MIDITPQLDFIRQLCLSLRVKRLSLVGSAARDDFDPTRSDVDLLVEFDGLDRLFDRNPVVRANLLRNQVPLYGT
jgi:predicted nucleotidyltransferase